MSPLKSPNASSDTAEFQAAPVVITIDGPAGAGKSTMAKLLAKRLGYAFLDTGAMYRCVTLAVLRSGMSIRDEGAVTTIAQNVQIDLDGSIVRLNGEDVSAEIRTPKVASAIGSIADNVAVRQHLSELQRAWARGKQVVTEGRDQGSEVFPDSPCKVFLTASSEERARRRQTELAARGIHMTYADVLTQQFKRDAEDISRPVGALRKAADAIEVCTDGASLEEVVEELVQLVRSKVAKA